MMALHGVVCMAHSRATERPQPHLRMISVGQPAEQPQHEIVPHLVPLKPQPVMLEEVKNPDGLLHGRSAGWAVTNES
jgi:hypothetical protein